MDQIQASKKVLVDSQKVKFPYTISAFGLKIIVRPKVFSPKHFRGWEIFTRNFPNVTNKDVVEIGCGTGVTALYLAKNSANKVIALDISPHAVKNTKENAVKNKIENIEVRKSDIFSAVKKGE